MSHSSPEYLIAIDSGGTKSQLFVWPWSVVESSPESSEELVLQAVCSARYDGINLDGISEEDATHRLEVLLREAAAELNMSLPELGTKVVTVMGMAGLDTDRDFVNAEKWFEDSLAHLNISFPYALISDVELGLWAATEDGVGVVLIAGTGSNCFGRNQTGQTAKAGGLSHFFSDEGGGFMLGWDALHHLGKMYDGREEKTLLFDSVLQHMQVADFAELKQRIVRSGDYKQAVAQVAPAVQQASEAGDTLARALIDQAVNDLEAMVTHVHRAVKQEGDVPVFFVGGLFHDGPYKEKLTQLLQQKGIASQGIHITQPAIGAIHFWRNRSVRAK